MNLRPIAPAVFHGIQDGFGVFPSIELWNLTANIPGHPEGSTISRQTLEKHGFFVPAAPLQHVA
ncbi:MAG: hypothetical protein HS122_08695 [Opitutaceae bacterium]|nr:hypothetical protein [Opitutaceae bacterium]